MKKNSILLFLVMLFVMTAGSLRAKEMVVGEVEHLAFEGIPINGNVNSFIKKLALKGIKAGINEKVETKYKGKNAVVEVRCDESSKQVYEVCLYTCIFPENYDNFDYYYNLAIKDIEKRYISSVDYFWEYPNGGDSGYDKVYTVYSVDNRRKKIGNISATVVYGDGDISLLIRYYDYANSLLYNSDYYAYSGGYVSWAEYPYAINNFSNVKIGLEERTGNVFIDCVSKADNTQYKYMLLSQDKHIFLNLLKTCKKADLRDYIVNYILDESQKVVENTKCTYVFYSYVETLVRESLDKLKYQAAQRQKRKYSPVRMGFMDLMHAIAPDVFTQREVELWNNLPPEVQGGIQKGVFGIFGGMGKSQWDSLSPEQKMQIHQYDNAK